MKFIRTKHEGRPRVGVIDAEFAVLLPEVFDDLVPIIEGGEAALLEAKALSQAADAQRLPLASLEILAPIGRFRRDVLCTGWNYHDHFQEGQGKREGQDAKELPKAPTFFTKAPDTVIGPRDDIAFDSRISSKWDYEAEVAVIIGKRGRSIPEQEAADHIFGYCLANDVSQRDLQRRHGGQWFKGKSIDRTMPLGPFVVTRDEIADLGAIRLQCLLNGAVMQDAVLAQMAFPVKRLIAELSFGMTLHPGDVLLTGTPAGVGFARTPPVFLAAGDEVTVRATGLGELKNALKPTDLAANSSVTIE
ncbi:fumarylacetoacetate hydrolase family protein [Bosea sp. F3-2]|uniref:fumarylacetoacetate hydrolase family protein n=1 Tax=Bosea sp. F3-2 TaxID=2599640 RepID=UPI0011EBB05F|nr:fumarylacetoacetate hydrolase family protein [Bosea sp. F3-2]QEL22902.1 fumarylacetoacetate hydrolase family protein [Bosea sp. F3-2]